VGVLEEMKLNERWCLCIFIVAIALIGTSPSRSGLKEILGLALFGTTFWLFVWGNKVIGKKKDGKSY